MIKRFQKYIVQGESVFLEGVMQSFTVQIVQLLKLRIIVLQTINSCETSDKILVF